MFICLVLCYGDPMETGNAPISKRVAVVGAGPSGLVTVKELIEEGHQPVCFERAPSLGGVFRFSEHDGVVWESCRLTSSGPLTAFSDYPMPPGCDGHLSIGQYVDYLQRYADAFDVSRHIRFGSTVKSVAQSPNDGWTVQTSDATGSHEESFDAVAICSGLHQNPELTKFAGQETFTGEIIHGARYRRPAQVVGKKVLIVGAGESGADIVAEVAANAAETVLSLRRGIAVLPRKIFQKPNDYQTSRIRNSSAPWVSETRNPADNSKRTVYRYAFLPLVVVDKCLQLLIKALWEFLPMFFASSVREIRTNLQTRKMRSSLLKESGGTLTEQFGTKSDDFVRAIVKGLCRRSPAISRFAGPRVFFEDGSHFNPDLVILCTGFETRIPILDSRLADAPRYLHAFNPSVGTSLGFIGFLRPAFGAIPPLAELQARWFARLQSGRASLPSLEEMTRSIDRWTQFRARHFRAVQGRLEHLVDHTSFCDELAAQIGCKPKRRDIGRESVAFRLKFYAAPFVSAQYRLVGPHAKPSIARDVITNLPIAHPVPDLINLYLRWAMSRALHQALGADFAPKLELQ